MRSPRKILQEEGGRLKKWPIGGAVSPSPTSTNIGFNTDTQPQRSQLYAQLPSDIDSPSAPSQIGTMGYGLGGAVNCDDVQRENNCFERDSCDGDSDDQPLDCAVSDVTHVSDTDLSVATQDGNAPRDYAGIVHDALGSDGADEQVRISNACKVGTLNPLAPTWPEGYRGNLSANLSDGSTIEGAVAPLAGCAAGSTVESPNRTPISSVPRDSLAQDSGSLEAQEDDHQKYLIHIHNTVRHSGLPNYRSARIPVPSGLNTDAWERYLRGHPDTELLDFLKYGWPVSYDYITPITSSDHNHPSAAQHSSHIDYYITTELGHRAMLGPFSEPPFSDPHFSPMMTRAKKDSPPPPQSNSRLVLAHLGSTE